MIQREGLYYILEQGSGNILATKAAFDFQLHTKYHSHGKNVLITEYINRNCSIMK
jgi:hypothetical protein